MVALSAGALLVANPEMLDPNFDRAVVLVLAHGGDGALGVVLNRPSANRVGERFSRWDECHDDRGVFFAGGPVNPGAVIGLVVRPPDATGELPEGLMTEVLTRVGVVDLDYPIGPVAQMVGSLRLFAGYAGWGPGQLEEEIALGGWWVVAAEPSDVCTAAPEILWRDVLRRQRGGLALVSSYSRDPHLN